MPVTYRRTNSDAALTGGQDFNKLVLLPASDTTGSTVVSLGNGETRVSRAFTSTGTPGVGGVTGNYTVEVNVTTGSSQTGIRVQLHRINAAGTVQSSSAFATQQTATAGTKTFSFTSLNLGTWAAGDRLRIDYEFANTGHGGTSCTISHGGTNNEVVAPWNAVTTATRTHTTDLVLRATEAPTHTTDLVKRARFTRTHTTDLITEVPSTTETRTQTTDLVLRATETGTHSTDIVLQATETETHTTDLVLQGTGGSVLLVVGDDAALTANDLVIQDWLATDFGATVTLAADEDAAPGSGYDLVVIGESVSSATILAKYKDVAMPIVIHESAIADEMELTSINITNSGNFDTITITDSGHALAAGRSGVVTFYSSDQPMFDVAAANIASGVDHYTLREGGTVGNGSFLYCLSGATLDDSTAADERRVYIPFNPGALAAITADGEALIKQAYWWASYGAVGSDQSTVSPKDHTTDLIVAAPGAAAFLVQSNVVGDITLPSAGHNFSFAVTPTLGNELYFFVVGRRNTADDAFGTILPSGVSWVTGSPLESAVDAFGTSLVGWAKTDTTSDGSTNSWAFTGSIQHKYQIFGFEVSGSIGPRDDVTDAYHNADSSDTATVTGVGAQDGDLALFGVAVRGSEYVSSWSGEFVTEETFDGSSNSGHRLQTAVASDEVESASTVTPVATLVSVSDWAAALLVIAGGGTGTGGSRPHSTDMLLSYDYGEISISGTDFYLDGTILNEGAEAEGLLMNVRMVQATVDFSDKADVSNWDAAANTASFISYLDDYKAKGVNSVMVNFQGGNFASASPATAPAGGYWGNDYDAGGWNANGTLRPAHAARMRSVLNACIENGITPMVGLTYFRQDQLLTNEAAVLDMLDNAMEFLAPWKNQIIVEVVNESENANVGHPILEEDRNHELVDVLVANGFIASASHHSGTVPTTLQQGDGQVVMLHANGETLAGITTMVNSARSTFPTLPIVINEDGHPDRTPAEAVSRVNAAVTAGAGWGFHEPVGYQYYDGTNMTMMDWSISSTIQIDVFDEIYALTTPTGYATHTTDLVVRATEVASHSTDLILQTTVATDHATDLVLQATEQATHSTDVVLRATETRTHSADLSLSGTETPTHTTDLLIGAEAVFVVPPTNSAGWSAGSHLSVDEWPWSDADACYIQLTTGSSGTGTLFFNLSDVAAPPTGLRFAFRHRVHAIADSWSVTYTLTEGTTEIVTTSPAITVTNSTYQFHVIDFDDADLTGITSTADLRVRVNGTNNSGVNSRYYIAGALLGINPFGTVKTELGGVPIHGWWSSRSLGGISLPQSSPSFLPDWSGRGQFLMGEVPATLADDDPDVAVTFEPVDDTYLASNGTMYSTLLRERHTGNFGIVAALRPPASIGSANQIAVLVSYAQTSLGTNQVITDKNIMTLDGDRGDGFTLMSGDGTSGAHLHGGVAPADTWQVWAELIQDSGNEHGWILVDGTEDLDTLGNTGLVIDGASGGNNLYGIGFLNREDRARPWISRASDLVLLDLDTYATEAERETAVTDAALALGAELGLWASSSTEQVAHSTDLVLQATEVQTHASDLIVQATGVPTHSTDLVLQATEQAAHSTDLVLQATEQAQHSTDLILQAVEVSEHSTDLVLLATEVSTHTTDLRVSTAGTELHSTDLIVWYDWTDASGLLAADTVQYLDEGLDPDTCYEYRVVAIFGGTDYPSTSTQALTPDLLSASHSTDLITEVGISTETVAHSTDLHVANRTTTSHATDLVLLATPQATHSTDAHVANRVAATHATDLVLLATEQATHSTDLVVVERTTTSHSTDLIGRETGEASHSGDLLVVERLDAAHSSDLVALATESLVHTSDLVTSSAGVLAHTASLFIQGEFLRHQSSDLVLQATEQADHSTDLILQTTVEADHTTDLVLQALRTRVHSADAVLQSTESSTHNTDLVLLATEVAAHSTDLILRTTGSEVHSTDALLRATEAATQDTDVLLVDRLTADHDTDLVLRATEQATHSTDLTTSAEGALAHSTSLVLKGLGLQESHSTDLILSQATELIHSTDLFAQGALDRAHSTNLILRATETAEHSTDLITLSALGLPHHTDLIVQATVEASHASDLIALQVDEIDHATDLVLLATEQATHSTDLVLQATEQLDHSTDVGLRATEERTHSTDLRILLGSSVIHATDLIAEGTIAADHDTDLAVADRLSQTHSTDTVLSVEVAASHSTDLVLLQTETYDHSSDLIVRTTSDVTHDVDVVIQATESILHTTDAMLLSAGGLAHGSDLVLRATEVTSHSSDMLVVAQPVATHSTDLLVKAPAIDHTTDVVVAGSAYQLFIFTTSKENSMGASSREYPGTATSKENNTTVQSKERGTPSP